MIFLRLLDDIIVKKIKSGNVQAFEDLINKYKSKVFNYCMHTFHNYHTAEEITQEVFVKVYTKIDTYDSKKAGLSTWIFTITHNTCINNFTNSMELVPIDNINNVSEVSLEEKILVNDSLSKLYKVLQSLSLKERSIIIMKDYLGFKNSEIAIIMGMPEGSVKSLLHNLRIKIRQKLGDMYD